MKYKILLMSVILTSSAFTFAQKSAKIKFDTKDHDFGKIHEEMGKVVVKFNFTNVGNDTLKISSADPSCSCTSADWTKAPVPPGGSGFVTADYDPRQRPGEFDKWVDVKSNANEPVVKLTIKGFVIARTKTFVDSFPVKNGNLYWGRKQINFKTISIADVKTDSLEIYNASSKPMKITFPKLPSYLTVKLKSETVAPYKRGMIYLKYDAPKRNDFGLMFDTIYANTDDADMPLKPLILAATVTDDFTKLTPAQKENAPKISFIPKEVMEYGSVKQGEVVKMFFEYQNNGKDPLIIRKASPGREDCKTIMPEKNSIAGGEKGKIGIEFNTFGALGNDIRRTILLTCNDPARPFIILIIKGNITIN